MEIKTLCGWSLQWIFQLICSICSFSEHLPCSDAWDQAVNNAAWCPNAQDHSGYQRAKGIAQSVLKEVRVGDPGPHSFPEKKAFLISGSCAAHTCPPGTGHWPRSCGSPPITFHRDHYNDWSPCLLGSSLLSRSTLLLRLYRVGLPWLWVWGWHHPHLQLQCSFVCTWKIPFPRQCPGRSLCSQLYCSSPLGPQPLSSPGAVRQYSHLITIAVPGKQDGSMKQHTGHDDF